MSRARGTMAFCFFSRTWVTVRESVCAHSKPNGDVGFRLNNLFSGLVHINMGNVRSQTVGVAIVGAAIGVLGAIFAQTPVFI